MSDDIIINLVPTYSQAVISDYSENIFGNGTITIDYGDGTTETYTGIIEHSYNDNDNHTITISGANSIGDSFLNYNSDVVSVTIPSTITSIGEDFLNQCDNLESVKFKSTTPPTATEYTFESISNNVTIYVPIGSISTYANAEYYPSDSSMYEEYSDFPTTLNGALELLGETMAENLTTQGLIGVSASDGLTTLANDILLIQGGGGGSDCSQYTTQIENAIEYINGSGS